MQSSNRAPQDSGQQEASSNVSGHGYVAEGFEPVAHAFQASIMSGEALGAACTIMHRGKTVVDLHGGWRDSARTEAWGADDIALVYSLTKGLTGMASAVAVSQGLFSYDERVSDIWPEFGAHGKEAVTVGEALSEQAGLAAIDLKLTLKNIGDEEAICAAIAGQKPNWKPGDYAGNHAYTLGWIASELIHRRDPQGRRLPQFFAEEVAGPLGQDVFIGLPESFDRDRIAKIEGFGMQDLFIRHTTMPWALTFKMCLPGTLAFRTLNNPLVLEGPQALDNEDYWRIGQGAAGGMASARGLATLYNAFAEGGEKLGVTPEVMAILTKGHRHPHKGLKDKVLTADMYYSHCFEKPFSAWEFARTRSAFGSFAVGGSLAFCDPEDGVAYAWITNQLGTAKWDDAREKLVRDAFYTCLENRS
ncbi:serine hydrolase domain-containing protein [Erythrobacter sp. F6033]|uniref:serine hydrolase domain-containing protein n=1 Tax=Erythrobacter sp. F6033 TaxID=2926401 RepID=UPI001FF66D0D|nr:serine hydrolase domain-containing protein [Erythrobacter sp. F6033]MCK0128657.1 beta-lactamase family protein [Erythrobacter sp. F6033]